MGVGVERILTLGVRWEGPKLLRRTATAVRMRVTWARSRACTHAGLGHSSQGDSGGTQTNTHTPVLTKARELLPGGLG